MGNGGSRRASIIEDGWTPQTKPDNNAKLECQGSAMPTYNDTQFSKIRSVLPRASCVVLGRREARARLPTTHKTLSHRMHHHLPTPTHQCGALHPGLVPLRLRLWRHGCRRREGRQPARDSRRLCGQRDERHRPQHPAQLCEALLRWGSAEFQRARDAARAAAAVVVAAAVAMTRRW